MPSADLAGIDHLVILVDDLAAAARRAQIQGFTVTPRSAHSRLGSANHCLMFEGGDYIELMGFVEDSPHLGDLRAHLAEHGPGPAALALRVDDADEGYEHLRAAGLEPEEPLDFGRPVMIEGKTVEVRFRIVRVPAAVNAGPPVFLCEHRTREQVWNPSWLQHRNGVVGLHALEGVAPTEEALGALGDFYRRLFGEAAVEGGQHPLEVRPREGAHLRWSVDPAAPAPALRRVWLRRKEGERWEAPGTAPGLV